MKYGGVEFYCNVVILLDSFKFFEKINLYYISSRIF